ncbi:MAG: glycosyltransferase family 39 protein, partial [Desulfosarcinaceae bacterium]
FFHKPPMIYWTQAVSVKLFGLNEFALRLPSALASLIWAFLLYLFAARYLGARTAWFAVFFLVTALQVNLIEKAAIADALLNLFVSAALFALYAFDRNRRRIFILAAYACMGMGFMTKGPIAVLIPMAVVLAWYASRRQWRSCLSVCVQPLGWLIFLSITLPWYVALYAKYGSSFIQEIFLVQNVGRFMKPMEGHSGPVFYYIPVILAGLIPFTTLLFYAGRQGKQLWQDDATRFLLIWFGFVFIFFSLAGTKLHHYIVYGYVPLLVFMAAQVERCRSGWLLALPLLIFALLLQAVPLVAARILPDIKDVFARIVISSSLDEFGASYHLLVAGLLLAALVTAAIRSIPIPAKTVIFGLLLIAFANFYLMPKVAGIMQMPIKSAALLARSRGYDVVMWKMNYPSFYVYYQKAPEKRKPKVHDIVITKAQNLKRLKAYTLLFEKHGIVLARVDSL